MSLPKLPSWYRWVLAEVYLDPNMTRDGYPKLDRNRIALFLEEYNEADSNVFSDIKVYDRVQMGPIYFRNAYPVSVMHQDAVAMYQRQFPDYETPLEWLPKLGVQE